MASAATMTFLEMGQFGSWLFATIFKSICVLGRLIDLCILQAKTFQGYFFKQPSFICSTVLTIMNLHLFSCKPDVNEEISALEYISSSLVIDFFGTTLDDC